MTSQGGPRGFLLERRNTVIETHQIGPHVKKKKKEERGERKENGHSDDEQHKGKGAADGE